MENTAEGYASIRAHIYPLQQYTDGTHSSILTAGRQAERRKTEVKRVKGVKGVSPLVYTIYGPCHINTC